MTSLKRQLGFGIGVAIILAVSPTAVVPASAEPNNELSASDILKRAKEKYASLTSYSDSGSVLAEISGMKLITTFKVRLERPGFYLVEWEQPVIPGYTNRGSVWSAGEGDFLKVGNQPVKQESRESALGGATGVSGSASATIPGTFFSMDWGNQFAGSVLHSKKQHDEKVGDVDCYVLKSDLNGRTKTLYIGKQDFLIHQVQTVTSKEAAAAAAAGASKFHSGSNAPAPVLTSQGIISTETHRKIVVNKQFSKEDFVPHDLAK
jgi:hypothetical protein